MDDLEECHAPVEVQYAQERGDPPPQQWVREVVGAALPDGGEVTVRFVSAAESREINKRHLGKDRPANVLAFPHDGDKIVSGDIAVCPAVVEDEARSADMPSRERYAHLLVHAVLHLRGMDHDTPEAAARMEAAEARLLVGIGLPDPFAAEK